jgi:hypothetical protein
MRLALNRFWALSLMVGLGFLLLGLLIWISFRGVAPSTPKEGRETKQPRTQTSQPKLTSPPPRAASIPVTPKTLLRNQLEQVVAGIREANQKKDLPRLLAYYSSNFPQLTQRAQTISKAWKVYDYPQMDFDLHGVRLLSANKANALVTWHVEAQETNTSIRKSISRTYSITFVNESKQWRIIAVEPAK